MNKKYQITLKYIYYLRDEKKMNNIFELIQNEKEEKNEKKVFQISRKINEELKKIFKFEHTLKDYISEYKEYKKNITINKIKEYKKNYYKNYYKKIIDCLCDECKDKIKNKNVIFHE